MSDKHQTQYANVLLLCKTCGAVSKQDDGSFQPDPRWLRANGSLKLLMIRSWERRGWAVRNQTGRENFFFFNFTPLDVRPSPVRENSMERAPEMFDLLLRAWVSANPNNEKSSCRTENVRQRVRPTFEMQMLFDIARSWRGSSNFLLLKLFILVYNFNNLNAQSDKTDQAQKTDRAYTHCQCTFLYKNSYNNFFKRGIKVLIFWLKKVFFFSRNIYELSMSHY